MVDKQPVGRNAQDGDAGRQGQDRQGDSRVVDNAEEAVLGLQLGVALGVLRFDFVVHGREFVFQAGHFEGDVWGYLWTNEQKKDSWLKRENQRRQREKRKTTRKEMDGLFGQDLLTTKQT